MLSGFYRPESFESCGVAIGKNPLCAIEGRLWGQVSQSRPGHVTGFVLESYSIQTSREDCLIYDFAVARYKTPQVSTLRTRSWVILRECCKPPVRGDRARSRSRNTNPTYCSPTSVVANRSKSLVRRPNRAIRPNLHPATHDRGSSIEPHLVGRLHRLFATVTVIHNDQLHVRIGDLLYRLSEFLHPGSLQFTGRVDEQIKKQHGNLQRIDGHMDLGALLPRVPIVAGPRSALKSRLQSAPVEDCRRRVRATPCSSTRRSWTIASKQPALNNLWVWRYTIGQGSDHSAASTRGN